MYNVQIHIQCVERFSEILLDDKANTEDLFEDLIRHILLEFFVVAIIDRISIHCLPDSAEGLKLFFLQMTARCASATYPLLPEELMDLELLLEDRMSCALLELVGRVDVENVSIGHPPSEEKGVLAYSA